MTVNIREKLSDSGADVNQINAQQSTKQIFSHTSWAGVSSILGGLGDCGSLGVVASGTLACAATA